MNIMLNRKIMVFGIVSLCTLLLANVTIGNAGLSDLMVEKLEPVTGKSEFKTDYTSDSDYILVRGNNEIIYVKLPSGLDDNTAEYIRNHYKELKEDENPEEKFPVEGLPETELPKEEAAEETSEIQEEVEAGLVTHRKTFNLTLPFHPEPLIIEEIKIKEIIEINSKDQEDDVTPFVDRENPEDESCGIRNFPSFEKFRSYVENNTFQPRIYPKCNSWENDSGTMNFITITNKGSAVESFGSAVGNSGSGYSITNVQVTGVDEGDIIKNDGKYAYIISKDENHKNKVLIIEAHPAENAKILSQIRMNGTIKEIYIYGDRLVLLSYENDRGPMIYIFGIKDKENPELMDTYHFKGNFVQSRLIGDYLYLISQQYVNRLTQETDLPVHPKDIYYFNNFEYSPYSSRLPITFFMSINVLDCSVKPVSRAIIMERSQNIFFSMNNIYITYTKSSSTNYYSKNQGYYTERIEMTILHRISIGNGMIQYEAMGEVPGHVLNRFSMGEHKLYFRIATTTGNVWRNGQGGARNHVHILDMDLNIVGNISDIAPGEKIYSARFMGNRAYLVTFKKVDPFFVIDLTDPYEPKILGELKIPGYSDYLHPYDENHIIGLGKDTVDMGTFAWYQGVKLSLFDVSDVKNPKEISKFIIGDRGTNSLALGDPHALLVSQEKNMLVLPIQLYEINESRYPNGAPPNTQGEYVWNGAYVLHISIENGFSLKGRISHSNGSEFQSGYSRWYRYNDNYIKRSFYIDDVLYTYSQNKLKMNKIDDLKEINELLLTNSTYYGNGFMDSDIIIGLK
ncbi:MAG: beta-propeller domain-containing protein [Thermoplasmata archaeon]|nr:MAG: beta-propeller domain-containing protein [Thermoplasmata archaeon]